MTDLLIGTDTFRIEVDGDTTKPALLLVHSLGADLGQWDAQMQALLKAFRVIRYDSRGHGGSTSAGAPYSIARLGHDALGILDALEIDTAHVVGVSMGGAVAQWLLTHAPDRVSRAVLANTTAKFLGIDSWNSRIVEVLGSGMESLTEGTMHRWFGDAFAAREPQRIDAVRATFEATSPEGYAGCCAALRDLDLREALHAVTAPVLVISGRDDTSIDATDIAYLAETIPGAKHVALDARHISNIEADAAFTKAVVGFLTAKLPVKRAQPAPAPVAAKATVSRRVGTRRSTAARIPLTAAPTSAKASKTPARKGPVKAAAPTKAASVSSRPTPVPVKRAATKPAAKAVAPLKNPAAKVAAKAPPAKKSVAAKPAPKIAKRPSAKSLKAMAAGTTTKARAVAAAPKAGKAKAPTKAAPVARRVTAKAPVVARKTAASVAKTPAIKAAAKKPAAPKVAAKTAKVKAPVAKVPAEPVVRKAPPKSAAKSISVKANAGKAPPARKTTSKAGAKSGRRGT